MGRQKEAEISRLEKEKQVEAALHAKQSGLPEEPLAGEPGRLQLVLRLPSGRRLQRAFRKTELIGHIYDFVDVQRLDELDGKAYRLISNMPRAVYEDRKATLEGAGISNQFVLMVEV